jgi:hypothetical protein
MVMRSVGLGTINADLASGELVMKKPTYALDGFLQVLNLREELGMLFDYLSPKIHLCESRYKSHHAISRTHLLPSRITNRFYLENYSEIGNDDRAS